MRAAAVSTAAAVLVGGLGIVGLARAAMPQGASAGADSTSSVHSQMDMSGMSGMTPGADTGGVTSADGSITITGAFVREPASPDVAAAYFTVHDSGHADTLVSVVSGAGQQTTLHQDKGTSMIDVPNGIPIPADSAVSLTTGGYHVMISQLIGTLKAGQTVDLQLNFAKAGTVNVVAPVIGVLAPAPTQGASK
jgi:copper(I)-binding protein